MKRRLFNLIGMAVVLQACNPQPSSIGMAGTAPLSAFIQEVSSTYPLPGLAVGVVLEDTAYFIYEGFSDLGRQTPVTNNTAFFAGSFSELMVATAALKLADEGVLRSQDPVVRHLRYFETQGPFQQVTIHHLLSHTSGIPHFSPAWDMPSYEPEALEATTRSIVYQPLEFEPGQKCKRSPYNYDIAADLLAKVRGKDFEQVVDESVFQPLRMHASSFAPDSSRDLAVSYRVKDWLSYEVEAQQIYPYTRENAGSYGLHTTVEDMAKWMRMTLNAGNESLLSESGLKSLMQKHYQTGDNIYKGYGWEIGGQGSETAYANTWSIEGFSGSMLLLPERKMGIVLLANTSDDFNPTVISDHIVHYLQGGTLGKVKQPIHMAMGRRLAIGTCMEDVLAWCDTQMAEGNDQYLINATMLGQLGVNLLHRASRTEDALRVFQYCVDKFPESPEAHLNLAEGLLAMGDLEGAKARFDEGVALNGQGETPYISFLRERLTVALENQISS